MTPKPKLVRKHTSNKGHTPKVIAKQIDTKELEVKCLELKKKCYSYREIGKAIGISEAGAFKAVQRILDRMEIELKEPAKKIRAVELQKLEVLEKVVQVKALNGDLLAVDRLVKIQERRARLTGIDAPTKLQHSGDEDNPIVFKDLSDTDLDRELNNIVTILGFQSLTGADPQRQAQIIDASAGEEASLGSTEP